MSENKPPFGWFHKDAFPLGSATDDVAQERCERAEAEVARLRKALHHISISPSGGELWPVGPTDTTYEEDNNTIKEFVGPWMFLNGTGNNFLEAVEMDMHITKLE